MRAIKAGILIASVSIVIGVSSLASNSEQETRSNENCLQSEQTAASVTQAHGCVNVAEESSWFSWLTGDSRSAQFHYLDFLELLTGSGDSNKPPSLKPTF
jgi:hypothetical protein